MASATLVHPVRRMTKRMETRTNKVSLGNAERTPKGSKVHAGATSTQSPKLLNKCLFFNQELITKINYMLDYWFLPSMYNQFLLKTYPVVHIHLLAPAYLPIHDHMQHHDFDNGTD